jgi:hypothetical protein
LSKRFDVHPRPDHRVELEVEVAKQFIVRTERPLEVLK